jgi:hypothetical protein
VDTAKLAKHIRASRLPLDAEEYFSTIWRVSINGTAPVGDEGFQMRDLESLAAVTLQLQYSNHQ